jgi:hypothetical protein
VICFRRGLSAGWSYKWIDSLRLAVIPNARLRGWVWWCGPPVFLAVGCHSGSTWGGECDRKRWLSWLFLGAYPDPGLGASTSLCDQVGYVYTDSATPHSRYSPVKKYSRQYMQRVPGYRFNFCPKTDTRHRTWHSPDGAWLVQAVPGWLVPGTPKRVPTTIFNTGPLALASDQTVCVKSLRSHNGHLVGAQGGDVPFSNLEELSHLVKDLTLKDKLCSKVCSSLWILKQQR